VESGIVCLSAGGSDKWRLCCREICVPRPLGATVEYLQDEQAARGKETVIFTKDMSIMEVLQANPRARDVFVAFGMGCVGCMGVSMESIEDGAKMHGIDVKSILAELNKLGAARDEAAG
jgi:hybrid cluster-associated redox disulfide protein